MLSIHTTTTTTTTKAQGIHSTKEGRKNLIAREWEGCCDMCFGHDPVTALINSLQRWLPAQDQAKIISLSAGSTNWTQGVMWKERERDRTCWGSPEMGGESWGQIQSRYTEYTYVWNCQGLHKKYSKQRKVPSVVSFMTCFLNSYLNCIYLHVCVPHAIAPMWRSEDDSQELVFSFHHVGPRGQTQVDRFVSKCLYIWAISLAWASFFLIFK